MVAYMLHPKYAGNDMDPEDAEVARVWLGEKNPEYLAAAISFQAEAHPYPKSFFLPTACEMKAVILWQAVDRSCILPKDFGDLVVTLHMATSSSASLERIFSSFGLVLTKLRNKLGLQRAQNWFIVRECFVGPRSWTTEILFLYFVYIIR